jgi:transcriptional regulator with GAF, ATPase, and Fis domain
MTTDQREQDIIESFVGFADRLIDDVDVLDLTTQLARDCARLLDVAAAGLLLADPGGVLHLLAATSEEARKVEAFQLQRDEGPCLDCYQTGAPVNAADLRTQAERWPRFTVVAAEQGIASVHAVPLRLRDDRLGALGLFGIVPGTLNDPDLRLAQGLAHVASLAIVQASRPPDRIALLTALQGALAGRAAVEVAKGVLAETHSVDTQEAFHRLRGYAHQHHRHLADVARAVISGELPATSITGPATHQAQH